MKLNLDQHMSEIQQHRYSDDDYNVSLSRRALLRAGAAGAVAAVAGASGLGFLNANPDLVNRLTGGDNGPANYDTIAPNDIDHIVQENLGRQFSVTVTGARASTTPETLSISPNETGFGNPVPLYPVTLTLRGGAQLTIYFSEDAVNEDNVVASMASPTEWAIYRKLAACSKAGGYVANRDLTVMDNLVLVNGRPSTTRGVCTVVDGSFPGVHIDQPGILEFQPDTPPTR